MNGQNSQIDFTVNPDNLYREESITDLRVASIRSLTPIKPDGARDKTREVIFVGHTQLMSPQGPVPLQAPLKATTLENAMAEFPEAMKNALEEVIENAKKMQAEQNRAKQQDDSRIILPK
jgi:hypothetical protein